MQPTPAPQKTSQPLLRQFIMEYGSILGLSWTAVFALYVIGLRQQSGACLGAAFLGLLLLLAPTAMLAVRIKVRTVQLQLRPTFIYTLLNVLSMFMYACLLCGAFEYSYFAFIDKDTLARAATAMLSDEQYRQLYTQAGMKQTYTQALQAINEFAALSAFDKTLLLFNQNFFTSLILSLPIGAISYYYKPRTL